MDEPPRHDDAALADMMTMLVGIDFTSAEGMAEAGGILREIEAKSPGALARLQVGLALRKSGTSLLADTRPTNA